MEKKILSIAKDRLEDYLAKYCPHYRTMTGNNARVCGRNQRINQNRQMSAYGILYKGGIGKGFVDEQKFMAKFRKIMEVMRKT